MSINFNRLFDFTRDNWTIFNTKLQYDLILNNNSNEKEVDMAMRLIHAYEMLNAIEKQTDDSKKTQLLKLYGSTVPLNYILSMNFNRNVAFDLPSGMPEIDIKDMDLKSHPDMMGLLSGNIKNMRYCRTGSPEGKNIPMDKKAQIFYNILVTCPLDDAEVLCAAKDKQLTELYPTITKEFVASVFPLYVKE